MQFLVVLLFGLASLASWASAEGISFVRVPGKSFDVVGTKDGRWLYVSATASDAGIATYKVENGVAKLLNFYRSPRPGVCGLALSRDEKVLVATGGSYVYFFDAKKLVTGGGGVLLGSLDSGERAGSASTRRSLRDDKLRSL